MSKDFLQEYFHADFKGIDSLLNEVLVPIFGDVMPGYTEITATETMREKARGANIQSIKHAATLWADGFEIKVFDVTLYDKCHIHIARKNIQTLIRQYVEHFEGALIAFHYANPEKRSWRLSYLEKRSSNNDSTSAKRYTYLCGRDYACRTIAERFAILAAQEKNAINIDNAFSVEALSNEFFSEYKSQYSDFCNYIIDNRTDETKFGVEFATCEDKFIRDYVKKMMGRLTFLHFLQKKGWMGQPRSIEGWGEGNINFLHDLFDKASDEQKDNFLDEILEPLFFECLNEKRDGDFFDTQVSGIRIVKIPYLNGGLFEKDSIDAPRSQFPREMFQRLFDFYGRYNFTIDENDPLDTEVGVDPEMLGKIFENLLEDNKDKGAFYTPKEIVQYMCKEALIAYLVGEAKKKSEASKQSQVNFEEAIRAFVNDPELTVPRIARYSEKQLHDLKESLENVKICDPAIGSGAFPMGLLNLLVSCREAVNAALRCGEPRSYLKQQIILNNIYGVDIEKGAIDIARLRFWLSIVVDEDEPTPLPNFDYKFMQGNSLLEQFEGLDLSNMFANTIDLHHKGGKGATLLVFDEEATQRALLREKMNHYFTLNADEDKHDIRKQVNKAVVDLVKEKTLGKSEMHEKLEKLDISANAQFFLWHTWFADVFEQGGFDIVIGNPPYIGEKGHKDIFQPVAKGNLGKYYLGKMDFFYFFFHLSINILKEDGINAFITTNYFPTATGALKLRNDFNERTALLKLINLNEFKIFDSALGQHNMITILQKGQTKPDCWCVNTSQKGHNLDILKNILNGIDPNTRYTFIPQTSIYDTEKLYIRYEIDSKNEDQISILNKISTSSSPLSEVCYIYAGLMPGCDYIAKDNFSYISRSEVLKNDIQIKDGVFVLDYENARDAKIYDAIKHEPFIKPFFKNSDVRKYCTINETSKFVIFSSVENSDVEKTKIKGILMKYKGILKRIREINNEDQEQWYLLRRGAAHPHIFIGPKIVCPYRTKSNIFGYNELSWFARTDVYYILEKDNEYPLKYVLGLLNSKLYYYWLYYKGKRKGEILEMLKQPLSEIPIKNASKEFKNRFISIVDQILSAKNSNPNANTSDLEKRIDDLVYDLYGLSDPEKEIVRNS